MAERCDVARAEARFCAESDSALPSPVSAREGTDVESVLLFPFESLLSTNPRVVERTIPIIKAKQRQAPSLSKDLSVIRFSCKQMSRTKEIDRKAGLLCAGTQQRPRLAPGPC